jgi:kynureninase
MTGFSLSKSCALDLDGNDPLKVFRDKFYIPQIENRDAVYLNGNSLGLQPKEVKNYLNQELMDWASLGGHGHFKAKNPWVTYHKVFKKPLSILTGSFEDEVTAMNSLTVNLHLLMVSFYRPTEKRFKILMEKGAFSSDQYAIETQIKYHGFDPGESIIEVGPREGEFTIRTEDILQSISDNADQLALILFGGVNFYTGQAFDMKSITTAGHEAGSVVGFDLAHAIGNIELKLHEWDVDFAVWCSYKYLNSGPGGVGGAFVNRKFAGSKDLIRLAGWWGYVEEERFKMEKGFIPISGVDGWQVSNVPILSMAAHKAALDIFMEAGFERLREKSKRLTGYLEFQLQNLVGRFKIVTPPESGGRGCQLSLYFDSDVQDIYKDLSDAGIIADLRRPNVIRVSPVPLYNSYLDVYNFCINLKEILKRRD